MKASQNGLPLSALAARLAAEIPRSRNNKLTYVARSETRAATLAALLNAMGFPGETIAFPAWDCLPYDRLSPSREVMGLRFNALRRIQEAGPQPAIVVTTPDAIIQRLPPATALRHGMILKLGDAIDVDALQERLLKIGYKSDDIVDEPGEIAFRAQVLEIFPAGAKTPCRIDIEGGRIGAIRVYDRDTQRSVDETAEVCLDPASEIVGVPEEERFMGMEHWLPGHYPNLLTFFDYTEDFQVYLEPNVDRRLTSTLTAIRDGYRDRQRWRNDSGEETARPPLEIEKLYLGQEEWAAATGRNRFRLDESGLETIPSFATMQSPKRAFLSFLKEQVSAGRNLIISAAVESDLDKMIRSATRRLGLDAVKIASWQEAANLQRKSIAALLLHADAGFIDREGCTLVTAADLFGSRARVDEHKSTATFSRLMEDEFNLNDVVIHMDHGIGVLKNLETLQTGELGVQDTLRLEYAKGTTLLAPLNDVGKMWRYGSDPDAVTLDRLKGTAWEKRKVKVEAQIAETAGALVAMARARDEATASVISPPQAEYEAFVAGFPFALTADQAQATEEVLDDLQSGKPMDRLVVGDVGFGKTEVALRAAAAVALAGKQVAFAAPTTVLVRQHLESFKRRFADTAVAIAQLSRLVSKKEAAETKKGLSDGRIAIVIGTHALAAADVTFKDLGLVIIDEEQRFGAAYKQRLRDLAPSCHVLTLTATPIPRTLQAARVGLQDLSVIATPPARRRPIRTFTMHPDMGTVRSALLREKRRGGQSFVVVPRIEDIDKVAADIRAAVPELTSLVAHGKIAAADVDDTMIRFAKGRSDILIATNIIETGLDVPNANTMFVWQAELFGLSQLHQLRGRVGRSRTQGVCYFLTETPLGENGTVEKRLSTLVTLDRLGSGMAIAMRDYDARGAGDLTGDKQSGHVKLIGSSLYQHLLGLALNKRLGREAEDSEPELHLDVPLALPAGYIPEPELRINLVSRIARVRSQDGIDRLEDELEDRFGELPEAVKTLLAVAQLKILCRDHGIARIESGPQAIAFWLRKARDVSRRVEHENGSDLEWNGERLIFRRAIDDPHERLLAATELLQEPGTLF